MKISFIINVLQITDWNKTDVSFISLSDAKTLFQTSNFRLFKISKYQQTTNSKLVNASLKSLLG